MILEVKNISKSFDGKVVLDDISFDLVEGNIYGLVGRNGAGKTTLLKILARIIDPDGGRAYIDVKDYFDYPQLLQHLAFLPDRFDFFAYNTGLKAMEYYQILYPNFNRDFVINEAKKLKLDLKKTIKTQSKGNKTLLGLLMVLASGAQFLLVDETLDGLDVLNKKAIIQYLLGASQEGRTVLISTHQLTELQGIADQVFYIGLDGKIQGVDKDKDLDFQKIQVVVKDKLPQEILDQVIVKDHLGRVYTVLMAGKEEEVVRKLAREEIVQFDILPLQIEDRFYFERGREEDHERL
ncbi:MAG: ATP-binding cassette domain-containing protein [Bacillota bacterium]|nr:ATP-binding cassette domain-containing protein [Bacillota bacterium]